MRDGTARRAVLRGRRPASPTGDHPLLPYPADRLDRRRRCCARRPPATTGPLYRLPGHRRRAAAAQLVAVCRSTADGRRGAAGALAARDDAELETVDADDAGRRAAARLERRRAAASSSCSTRATGTRTPAARACRATSCPAACCPATAAARGARRRGPAPAAASCGGSTSRSRTLAPVTARRACGRATRERPGRAGARDAACAHDGLALTGWLYRRAADAPAPVRRCSACTAAPRRRSGRRSRPQHQALVAAGITVLRPEHPRLVRLRARVRARRRPLRPLRRDRATSPTARRRWSTHGVRRPGPDRGHRPLLRRLPDPAGAGLLARPSFAAGVDICGMSDLLHLLPRHRAVDRRRGGRRSTATRCATRALLAETLAAAPRRRDRRAAAGRARRARHQRAAAARRSRSSRGCASSAARSSTSSSPARATSTAGPTPG